VDCNNSPEDKDQWLAPISTETNIHIPHMLKTFMTRRQVGFVLHSSAAQTLGPWAIPAKGTDLCVCFVSVCVVLYSQRTR
jgi:hypothetical protein